MSDSPGLVDFAILFSSVLVLIKNICTTSFFTDTVASVSYMCWRCNSVSFSPSKLCLFAKHLSLNSFYTKANLQYYCLGAFYSNGSQTDFSSVFWLLKPSSACMQTCHFLFHLAGKKMLHMLCNSGQRVKQHN